MTTQSEEIIAKEAKHVLQVYKRIPVMFVRGQGSHLIDEHGQQYLDLLSGIGVASLGHAHTGLAEIIGKQAHELVHTSNLYFHPLQAEVASRLSCISGLERTFFCNSGTEAVEACLKFARRYWHSQGSTDRSEIVAFEGSFHGRTFGSLSVTAGEPYRVPFSPLLPGIRFVSPMDIDQIKAAITDRTAAVIVEPIQGEGGGRPIPSATANAISDACRATQTLLIADEVQCGLGRTGQPFYSPELGLTPDLMSLGKALGAGIPIGAALLNEKVSSAVSYGAHGSTYGGNLLACQAALVFLNALEDGLLQRVAEAGARLRSGLDTLVAASEELHEVRGAGLMCGIEVDVAVAEQIVNTALEHKLLINRTAGTVVRLLPPLTISNEDIDDGLVRLRAAFADAGAQFH